MSCSARRLGALRRHHVALRTLTIQAGSQTLIAAELPRDLAEALSKIPGGVRRGCWRQARGQVSVFAVCNGDLTAMLAAGNRDVADGVAQPTAATT